MNQTHYQACAYNSQVQIHGPEKPRNQFLAPTAGGVTQPHYSASNLFLIGNNWDYKYLQSKRDEVAQANEIPLSSLHDIKTSEIDDNAEDRFLTHDHWVIFSTNSAAFLLTISAVFALILGGGFPIAAVVLAIARNDISYLYDPTSIIISLSLLSYVAAVWFSIKKGIVRYKAAAILFRTSGKVHFFPRGDKEPIITPYRDWDCSISYTSGHKGGKHYSFWMSHRYQKELNVMFPNAPGTRHSGRVQAEIIECFMDISRPLPDIPELELYRQYDPVTAEWDARNNRPPRLFRDMSKETWNKLQKASWKYATNYRWSFSRERAIAMGWQPPPKQWWTMADETTQPE